MLIIVLELLKWPIHFFPSQFLKKIILMEFRER